MKPGKQEGVAAVELALIFPILLVAVFGITELGRALYQYNALVKATRDAVRYLAQQDLANPPTGETADSIRQKAILVAVCGAPDCTDPTPRFPGLTLNEAKTKVTLCDYLNSAATHKSVETTQGTVDLVTVMIGDSECDRDVDDPRPANDPKIVHFTSMMPQVFLPSGWGWGIPDIALSAIKTTMASRYF